MKKYCLLFVCTLLLLGCKKYDDSALWDSVNNLKDRVTQLEELCKQVNTNITALQTIVSAVQSNDYITAVTPIKSGNEEIGYTIAFANHDPITIYHGKDGIKGADGNDAQPPMIGVQQHDDGIYYWTLNGEWLTDPQGNKVKAQGNDGSTGKSAYELAVEKGYSGSLNEWLASLNGTSGNNGKSAYELAVENGYRGTQTEWLESLKGNNGKDGKSAYELAVEKGYSGTIEQWIASLNGTNGNNGKSAYELAVEKGYQGTIEEWLESLKGSQGQQGATGNNGITPKLKIGDDNYWYVSYDNEASWVSLNVKATGENGKDGNSIIKSVTEDDNYVYFTLTENDRIITIAKTTSIATIPNNIIYYTSSDNKIVTPYTIDGFGANIISNTYQDNRGTIIFDGNVSAIGEQAFFRCKTLTSITLPTSITKIGGHAFQDCNLSPNITFLPDQITEIGDYAFEGQPISSIILPKNIKKLGMNAFRSHAQIDIAVIFCPTSTPPTLSTSSAFAWYNTIRETSQISSATICIPINSLSAYNSEWSRYRESLKEYEFKN